MKRGLSLILSLVLVLSIASTGMIGLNASAASTSQTVQSNYDKVCSYIKSYGSTSEYGYKYVSGVINSDDSVSGFELQVDSSSVITMELMYVSATSSSGVYFAFIIDATIYKTKSTMSVVQTMGVYYDYSYSDDEELDSAYKTGTFDRTTYNTDTTYSFGASGSYYIDSESFSNLFNAGMELLLAYWDEYLYDELGFGINGLGFRNYDGYSDNVCDTALSYHIGGTELKNAKAATCVTDGYSGDTYCKACGTKISAGTVIESNGSHTYDDDNDEDCNKCGETRDVIEDDPIIDNDDFTTSSPVTNPKPTVADNYEALINYIMYYGEYDSYDGTYQILLVDQSDDYYYGYYLITDGSTISMKLVVTSDLSRYYYQSLTATLSAGSTTFEVENNIGYWYYGDIIDVANKSGKIDMTDYDDDDSYALYASGYYGYISKYDFCDLFNSGLDLLFIYWDINIYSVLGFGLKGLGLHSYSVGLGSDACDPLSSYHLGEGVLEGKKDAGCVTNGYTGDTYCSCCGEKIATGTVVSKYGSHEYTNSCDASCNRCGETRNASHNFGSDDICTKCGEKAYTAGDLTNDGKINSLDGLMLMRYLNGWNVNISSPDAMDVNGDGKVNSLDGLMLMRYLNGWNIQLG